MDWRAWENTVGETRESRDSSESESQGRGEGQRSEVRGLGKEPRGTQGRQTANGWAEGSGGKELSGSRWRLLGSM